MYFIYCIILCPKLYIEIFFYAGFSTGQKYLESEHKHLESEHKRTEADAELKEEVKHLKSILEQQAIQMAKQRRHLRNSK